LAPQAVFEGVPTQTLREILNQAVQSQPIEQQPLNILLLGRTGAGKSSLVNTLFRQELTTVDALPSTDVLQSYPFNTPTGDVLLLWDSPGYEQVGREQYSQLVLDKAQAADLVLLVTPVQDPTLQMDLERLTILKRQAADLPILTAVTQVDRLRPQREWEPPYDWMMGDRPKERNIREAITYRQHCLEPYSSIVLPVVTEDLTQHRAAWGISELSQAILDTLEPAQQFRMSRFLRDLETRTQTAARIIDQYILQMSTTQGLTALFKRPVLQFLSTLLTGSPTLALLLVEKVPLEQSPLFLGKLQMTVELYTLLCPADFGLPANLLHIWPLLLEHSDSIAHDAWALGHTLVEYWAQPSTGVDNPSGTALSQRYSAHLQQIQSQSIQ
ncbi:MAG TPA: GTPase, partial [Stenomitos sp.]